MNLLVLNALQPDLLRVGLNFLIGEIDGNIKVVEPKSPDDIPDLIASCCPHIVALSICSVDSCLIKRIFEGCSSGGVRLMMSEVDPKQKGFRYLGTNLALAEFKGALEDEIQLLKEELGAVIAEELTAREKEIIRDIALGLSSKEMADKNFISPHTVITHRKNISKKLGIKSISGLTIYAIINKLISIDDIKENET